jgi:hypothetical protein
MCDPKHLCTKKLIHKPISGLDLGKKTEDPKRKRKEGKKVENIGPNKIVVCTEMVMYYT